MTLEEMAEGGSEYSPLSQQMSVEVTFGKTKQKRQERNPLEGICKIVWLM